MTDNLTPQARQAGKSAALEAMQPYQDAITARTWEYHALTSALDHVDSAIRVFVNLDSDDIAAQRHLLQRTYGNLRQATERARGAMDAAGQAAAAEWARRTGNAQ